MHILQSHYGNQMSPGLLWVVWVAPEEPLNRQRESSEVTAKSVFIIPAVSHVISYLIRRKHLAHGHHARHRLARSSMSWGEILRAGLDLLYFHPPPLRLSVTSPGAFRRVIIMKVFLLVALLSAASAFYLREQGKLLRSVHPSQPTLSHC